MHSQRQVFQEKTLVLSDCVCTGFKSSYAYSSSKHTTIPHGFVTLSKVKNENDTWGAVINSVWLSLSQKEQHESLWNRKKGLSEQASHIYPTCRGVCDCPTLSANGSNAWTPREDQFGLIKRKRCVKREERTVTFPPLSQNATFESYDVGTVSPLIEPLEVF
jgi:hypothetical protein